jgi:hypothetical protein
LTTVSSAGAEARVADRDVHREVAIVGVELAAAQVGRLVLSEHVVERRDLRVPLGELEDLVVQVAHPETTAARDRERPLHVQLEHAARRERLGQPDPGERAVDPEARFLGLLLLTEGPPGRKLIELP